MIIHTNIRSTHVVVYLLNRYLFLTAGNRVCVSLFALQSEKNLFTVHSSKLCAMCSVLANALCMGMNH